MSLKERLHDVAPPGRIPRNPALTAAFTLIEMSIVLVIIGLVVGGILVGQDLIKTAQVRSMVTQLGRFNTAVNTFKTKYDCIPGTCANPSQFGLPGITNLTMVLNTWNGSVNDVEHLNDFWGQLQAAGLVTDGLAGGYPSPIYDFGYVPGWESPVCPLCMNSQVSNCGAGLSCTRGGWTLWNVGNINLNCGPFTPSYSSAGGAVPATSYVWDISFVGEVSTGGAGGVIKPSDARLLDQKIDDGLPLTGSVIAINDYTYSSCAPASAPNAPAISVPQSPCINAASNAYLLNDTGNCGPSMGTWGVDMMLPAQFTD